MKNVFKKWMAVALCCGAGLTASCGAENSAEMAALGEDEQPRLNAQMQALVEAESGEAFAPRGGETSAECKKINARMAKHGRAMARTKQFKAMIRTEAYKDLAKDIVEMKRKGCSMGGPGGGGDEGGLNMECLSLQLKAYQHQQVLMGTPEYKALEKTRAYKRLTADMQEAQQKGCIKMFAGFVEEAE